MLVAGPAYVPDILVGPVDRRKPETFDASCEEVNLWSAGICGL